MSSNNNNNPFLHLDPIHNLNSTYSEEEISKYFSESYKEASQKFFEASQTLSKQRLCSHEYIPICPDRFHPNKREEDCNMQITVVSLDPKDVVDDNEKKKKKAAATATKEEEEEGVLREHEVNADTKLLVVVSGVHGVEGYAGSAIQLLLLEKLLLDPPGKTSSCQGTVPSEEEEASRSSSSHGQKPVNTPDGSCSGSGAFLPNTLLILVHSVNPFGMKYFRRTNENNVDLNRNALTEEEFTLLSKHDQLQPNYDKFDALFNPTKLPSLFYQKIGFFTSAVREVLTHGVNGIKTALVAATYQRPKGIFFGGTELQKSHIELRDYFQQRFGPIIQSRNVVWMDLHTGLGPCGMDVILSAPQDASVLSQWFPKVDGQCEGVQITSKVSDDDDDGSDGSGLFEDPVRKRCDSTTATAGGKKSSPIDSMENDHWLLSKNACVKKECHKTLEKGGDDSRATSTNSHGESGGNPDQSSTISSSSDGVTNRLLGSLLRFMGLESKSQSTGYEFTCGFLACHEWLSHFFQPSSGRVLAFTQEFGTQPNLMVAHALCMENCGFHNDTKERHIEYWAPTYTKPAFYCSDNIWWKRRILNGGENMVGKIWEHCSHSLEN